MASLLTPKMTRPIKDVAKLVHYNGLLIWRTKSFWVRALLCWMVGAVLLIYDESSNFDLRLKIRGARPADRGIVLVDLSERDWSNLDPESRNVLRPLKEVVTLTDAYFWNPRVWDKMLSGILSQSPRAVGVTLFFGENVRSPRLSAAYRTTFEDPRVVWGADIDNSGRMLVPQFATTYNANVGLRGMRVDDDGIVRRFVSSPVQVPHLAVRLAAVAQPSFTEKFEARYQSPTLINFTGGDESFPVVNASDVVEGRVSPDVFKDRVVIIGSLGSSLEQMQTPLGRMSRALVTANVTDNILGNKSIARWPTGVYLALLAIIMAGAIWVLTTYPQSVTLAVFAMAAMIWAAASVWAFDALHFWLPLFSPLGQLTLSCIVFLSYQLAMNEQRTWRLEQEQRYRNEIEQLKSNFVSMMSHDLKTPIAKIQAICDRLLASVASSEVSVDLKSLRRSSDELHRYIQSILQVTKVEAKDFKIQKEVVDINESIERVVSRVAPLAREKGIAIETNLEPMFSIEADSTLIQEVIHNLIENAVKYSPACVPHDTPARALYDAAKPGRVTVTSQEKDDNVEVIIEDEGPGIDPADQEGIWRKFTRGRSASESEIKGTGLGLYLVKYFIELHGGAVFLESEVGRGTRVGFRIPVAPDSASESAPTPAAEADQIGIV